MLNKVFKAVSNGEIIKVIEFDDKSKQCIVKLEDGRTKAYSSATLKDKRRFTLVAEELSDEDYAAIGKEIAEQAKAKAEAPELVPMPGSEKLADLKKETSGTKARISITYRGQTKTPFEWGRLLGLDPKYIRAQLRKGKTPEEIFKEKK